MENLKLEVKKSYKVGDTEYNSKEEAFRAAAMEVLHNEIPLGLDNVVQKHQEIIKALQIVSKTSKK